MRRLRSAVQEAGGRGQGAAQGLDRETAEFLTTWLQNNKPLDPHQGHQGHPGWWKSEAPAVHDLSRLEERMLGMEAEKDTLQLQVGPTRHLHPTLLANTHQATR